MTSRTSRAFAGRLPAEKADLLEAAIEESNETKSDIVERALCYYLQRNPDRLDALRPMGPLDEFMGGSIE